MKEVWVPMMYSVSNFRGSLFIINNLRWLFFLKKNGWTLKRQKTKGGENVTGKPTRWSLGTWTSLRDPQLPGVAFFSQKNWRHYLLQGIRRLQICPLYIFGNKATKWKYKYWFPGFGFDSGLKLQPWIIYDYLRLVEDGGMKVAIWHLFFNQYLSH